jgi:hypothetical protein
MNLLSHYVIENPQSNPNSTGHNCFPSGTVISLLNKNIKIEQINVSDKVLSFDTNGAITEGNVVRIFRGVTTEWLILSCGLTVTPGHLFLNEYGRFERVDELVARNGAIVRRDGSLERVCAERVIYSETTRHQYEEAEEFVLTSDGSA